MDVDAPAGGRGVEARCWLLLPFHTRLPSSIKYPGLPRNVGLHDNTVNEGVTLVSCGNGVEGARQDESRREEVHSRVKVKVKCPCG